MPYRAGDDRAQRIRKLIEESRQLSARLMPRYWALLDADVSKVVVDDLVERVTNNALGGEVTEGVDPSQQFVKIVYDELKRAMGGDDEALMSGGEGEQSVRAELEYRGDG